ncbi:MAG: hypothetical protein H7Y08_08445, partial [Rhizobiaceae bacterium]|nr:hypothetical protein [Rhizobiaceae bacterium]
AILAIPFFVTVFAIVETSLVFLAELTLDQSVDRVARKVRTGELERKGADEAALRSDICSGVAFLLDCDKLVIDLKIYEAFSDLPPPSPVVDGDVRPEGFGYELAGPEAITALRVYYKFPIQTDIMRSFLSDMEDGSHLLFSMAAFRTEPFR